MKRPLLNTRFVPLHFTDRKKNKIKMSLLNTVNTSASRPRPRTRTEISRPIAKAKAVTLQAKAKAKAKTPRYRMNLPLPLHLAPSLCCSLYSEDVVKAGIDPSREAVGL